MTTTTTTATVNKPQKLHKINYQSNLDSDYTEKMQELDRDFKYEENKDHFWSDQKLSLLSGTPLFEQASREQKLALNHLYWASQYEFIAASEASGILYNDVAAGVFSTFDKYKSMAEEISLESIQERSHIHVFNKISYRTKNYLLGDKILTKFTSKSQFKPQRKFNFADSSFDNFKNMNFWVNKLKINQFKNYSLYLKELENKGEFPAAHSRGCVGISMPKKLLNLYTISWGSSPFLACQYFAFRYLANMGLKVYEHRYFKHYKELEKNNQFIPTPTAISYYHLLDEAFHTTTSYNIGRNLYREFSTPNLYEKAMANLQFYLTQKSWLGGLSGTILGVFRDDAVFMPVLYRILTSPVFGFSTSEALHWLEDSLCCEHENFHNNLEYHQRLLSNIKQFFSEIDYLYPVNRDVKLMAQGGNIDRAINRNKKALDDFAKLVTD